MQKTSNLQNQFLSSSNPPLYQQIVNTTLIHHLQSHQLLTQPIQKKQPLQNAHKPVSKRNFQYYFYDKYSSNKQLNKIRNSPTTKKILQKQRLKSVRLDNELIQKQKQLIEGQPQQSDNIPFYKRYKPQPILKDPQLADYGQFYSRKNLKRQTSAGHNFEKLKHNKQNIYKYRQTKGMISPSKKHQQSGPTVKPIDTSPRYNQSLSPFEFKKTIQGRLVTRSDKNIRMDLNKTHKINNLNKIWYTETEDAQKDNLQFLQMRKSIEQILIQYVDPNKSSKNVTLSIATKVINSLSPGQKSYRFQQMISSTMQMEMAKRCKFIVDGKPRTILICQRVQIDQSNPKNLEFICNTKYLHQVQDNGSQRNVKWAFHQVKGTQFLQVKQLIKSGVATVECWLNILSECGQIQEYKKKRYIKTLSTLNLQYFIFQVKVVSLEIISSSYFCRINCFGQTTSLLS